MWSEDTVSILKKRLCYVKIAENSHSYLECCEDSSVIFPTRKQCDVVNEDFSLLW